ncbi:MAG: FtsX-like permease family protein [Sulfurovaceae bacterium]|nr:FtsX-like permease family protein [Sulfurovaceae bacterium]
MLFSLAFKNILASKGRTFTTFILSMFTTIFFIVYVAFTDGTHEQIIKNSVEIYTGYAHINTKGYQEESDYDHLIENSRQLETFLSRESFISQFSPRFETYVLLSQKDKTVGSMLSGIIPSRETNLSYLKKSLIKGSYLEDNDTKAIYLGSDLAKRLSVDVGDEIAMIGSSLDYSTAAELFKVKGIFKTGLFEFDSTSAFANKAYLDQIMLSENKASYFVLRFVDNEAAEGYVKTLNENLPKNYESLSWKDLLFDLVQLMQVDSLFGYISISVFFFVIFFVIMIFNYVNIYTRVRQIGLLRALGMTPKDIKTLLFNELFIITLFSVILGAVIGSWIAYYFEVNPITIPGLAEMYKDYGIVADVIPTRFDIPTIIWNTFSIFVLNISSIFYPIYKINKLSVIEAMRYV